jgi:hypothetical protein
MYFTAQLYALMVIIGMGRSMYINNLFGNCMEMAGPSQAVMCYMVEMVVEGIAGTAAPYVMCRYFRQNLIVRELGHLLFCFSFIV